MAALSVSPVLNLVKIQLENAADEELDKIRAALVRGAGAEYPRYTWLEDRLFFQERLVISRSSSLIPILLREFHGTAIGGHSRALKTHKRISCELYGVGMKVGVEKYVTDCDVCLLVK